MSVLLQILEDLARSATMYVSHEVLTDTGDSASVRVRVSDHYYVLSLTRDGGPAANHTDGAQT